MQTYLATRTNLCRYLFVRATKESETLIVQRERERERDRERDVYRMGSLTRMAKGEGRCVCEIQPSCSAGNNGRVASVEMQIRERVADSLIHVRGLWFRATRNAAYIRGIKEFVLEFCTGRRRDGEGGREGGGGVEGEGRPLLYNVTESALPLPTTPRSRLVSPARIIMGQN